MAGGIIHDNYHPWHQLRQNLVLKPPLEQGRCDTSLHDQRILDIAVHRQSRQHAPAHLAVGSLEIKAQ
jgi:hypothetical protein